LPWYSRKSQQRVTATIIAMTATGAAKSGASGSGTSVTNERKPVGEQDGGGDTATATTIVTVTGTITTGNTLGIVGQVANVANLPAKLPTPTSICATIHIVRT